MSVIPEPPQASEPVPDASADGDDPSRASEPVPDASADGEDPSRASEPVPDGSVGGEDLLGLRIGAALIDLALLLVLFVVLAVLVGEAIVNRVGVAFSFTLDGAGFAVYVALALLYYLVLEAAIGQTVGKLLVGLRVVRAGGGRPNVLHVAARTLVRVVDWLPAFYLVGFIAMLATGARRQRLGDLAADTRIARAVPMRHRGLAAAGLASSLVLVLAGSVVYVARGAGSWSATSPASRRSTTMVGRSTLPTSRSRVWDALPRPPASGSGAAVRDGWPISSPSTSRTGSSSPRPYGRPSRFRQRFLGSSFANEASTSRSVGV